MRTEKEIICRNTPFQRLPERLTLRELQSWLGLSRSTVYRLVYEGRIPTYRVGRRHFVPKSFLGPE
jgi:excisionase family DNA binding protein